MRGEGGGVEEFRDGFTGEGGFYDFFEDDTRARGVAERNSNDVAGL